MRMRKFACLFTLMIAFAISAISFAVGPVKSALAVTYVTTRSVEVENGSSIVFSSGSEMEHDVLVYGSGDVTFTMTFDSYDYTADSWCGSMEVKKMSEGITSLNINIVAQGISRLYGDNHPGIRLPSGIPVTLSFYLQQDAELNIGAQDVNNLGICNQSDNINNLSYALYNVHDADIVLSRLNSGANEHAFVYENLGQDSLPHTHVSGDWIIDVEPTCVSEGSKHKECIYCGETTETSEIEPTGHNLVYHFPLSPTCTTDGWTIYSSCSVCHRYFDGDGEHEIEENSWVLPATGHDWSEPTYEWSEDLTQVIATRICNNDHDHVEMEIVDVNREEIPATCEEDGLLTYTSDAFENEAFEVQIKEFVLEAIGHDWGEPTYEWSEDNLTLTATRVCNHDHEHVETEMVEVGYEEILPTCEENGLLMYMSDVFENEAFEPQYKEIVLEALGHDWNEPTYEWNGISTRVTATRICERDHNHIETEVVDVNFEKINPTCEEDGILYYTSKEFENEAFEVQKKELILPATGHDWGEPTYEWSEDLTLLTAMRVCNNDSDHIEIETVGVSCIERPATCEEDGLLTYTSNAFTNRAFEIQIKEIVLEALGHDWSAPTYEWSEDLSTVTATRICNNDHEHIETETVVVNIEGTSATCEEDGLLVYISDVFENEAFEVQIKEVFLEALGHNWSEPTYEWNGISTRVTATRICERDHNHIETEVVDVNFERINPTCEEDGIIYYTSNEFENEAFEVQKKELILPATGHNWGTPTYEWSEDNLAVTATRICNNDHEHIETETVGVSFEEIHPTCEEEGLLTYTSNAFANEAFEVQIKEIVLEAIGHDWSAPIYEWSADLSTVTATRICNNDHEHIETETVVVNIEETPATCEEDGLLTYTSNAFANEAFEVQIKEIVLEALGHDLIHHDSKPATFDEIGWEEYDTCSRCDYTTYVEIPPLERPDPDDPEAQEEFKEAAIENIAMIIGDDLMDDDLMESLEKTSIEIIIDVFEVAAEAYNSINDIFDNLPEGVEAEVQPGVTMTKEEAHEIIKSFTVSTIVIAGSKDESIEEANRISDSLPSNLRLDVGAVVSDFYEKVLLDIFAGPNTDSHQQNYALILYGVDDASEAGFSVDFSVSASTYDNAHEFVETTVNNITGAVLKVRECSGEELKSHIDHYISGVSVKSFRDFDREKADAEFAELAYQAILISLQETVINTLNENYEKASAGKSGTALSELKENYERELEQVSHLHFLEDLSEEECEGCFEDVIVEVMRLKYLSILNNKRDNKEISDAQFVEYAAKAVDVETFKPTYREIFFCWATGKEDESEVKISLQELSDAAIENTSSKIAPVATGAEVQSYDWILIACVGGSIIVLAAAYLLVSKKKKEG